MGRGRVCWAVTLLAGLALAYTPARAQDGDAPARTISPAKLNHYIKGFNFLVGTFGLNAQSRLYTAQQISRKSVNDPVNISDGWLDQGDDELKQGYAMPGATTQDLDAAASAMTAILDRLVERLKGLESYYASRGQIEDNFARGKREDPLVLADFRAALTALQPLSDSLDAAIEQRDMAHIAALKAEGDLIGYDGRLALLKAKRLVDLFHNAQNIHKPEVVAQGDSLAAEILAALSDENTALSTAKAADDKSHSLRNSNYGMAAERLQTLVGAYRDMKRTGNVWGAQMMLGAYNSAVEEINIGQ